MKPPITSDDDDDDDDNDDDEHDINNSINNDDDDDDGRVVLHFDLDAFYVACERELNPHLLGVPVAVSQYNPYGKLQERNAKDIYERWVVKGVTATRTTHVNNNSNNQDPHDDQQRSINSSSTNSGDDTNGSLIAVSYEARASGVKRNQRGNEACQACKDLNIVQVPVKYGKADLTMYRTASKRIMEALRAAVVEAASKARCSTSTCASSADETEHRSQQTQKQQQQQQQLQQQHTEINKHFLVEVASIDEVYMDVTTLVDQLVRIIVMQKSSTQSQINPKIMYNPYSKKTASSSSSSLLWRSILEIAGTCTTIGGVEVLSDAAKATNALGKSELTRGSQVQVLDSKPGEVDPGSRAWWHRRLSEFSNIELRLVCGAYLAAQARAIVQLSFGIDGNDVFTLSAGISTNKTLAKLASGMKKPNRQTLISRQDPKVLQTLFHPLPLGRIRGLGGKLGTSIAKRLGITTVGQLAELPLDRLRQALSSGTSSGGGGGGEGHSVKTSQFLYDISRGLCRDPVTPRNKPKSIECSKTFFGPLAISVKDAPELLEKWVGELCGELQERLQQDQDENHRRAATMKVVVQFNKQRPMMSKQGRAPRSLEQYPKMALNMIRQLIDTATLKRRKQTAPYGREGGKNEKKDDSDLKITCIGIGGTQFVPVAEGPSSILSAMQKSTAAASPSSSSYYKTNIDSVGSMTTSKARSTQQQPKKRSSMELWLQDSDKGSNKIDGNNHGHSSTTSESPPKRAKASHVRGATTTTTTKQSSMLDHRHRPREAISQPNSTNTITSKTPSTRSVAIPVPCMDEIDKEVLQALPKELQRAIMGDIRYQQQQQQQQQQTMQKHKETKRGGIQSFFQARKPK